MTSLAMTVCPTAPPPSKAPPTDATPLVETTPPTLATPSIMATPLTEATPTPMVVVVKREEENSCCSCCGCCSCDFSGSIPLPGLTGISITQIIISAAVIIAEIISLNQREPNSDGAVGVWTSIFICLAGAIGICAAKKTNKCTVQCYLVLSIVALCCSIALIIGTGAAIGGYRSYIYFNGAKLYNHAQDVPKVLNWIMLVFGLGQLALTFSGAVIAFGAVCCKERNTMSDQVLYLSNGQNGPIWRREMNGSVGPHGPNNWQSGPNEQNGPQGQSGPHGQSGLNILNRQNGSNGQSAPNRQNGLNGQSEPNRQNGPNWQSGQNWPNGQNGQSLVNWHYEQSGPNGQSGPREVRPGAQMMGDKPGNLQY